MASYVVKVQFEDSVRRLSLGSSFSYEQLVSQTRNLFKFPAGAQLVLTYVDRDGDVVTMAEDGDLQDALVLQSLNPLRVKVTILRNGEVGLNRDRPADGDVQVQSSQDKQKQDPPVKTDAVETREGVAAPAPAESTQNKQKEDPPVKIDGKETREAAAATAPAEPTQDEQKQDPPVKTDGKKTREAAAAPAPAGLTHNDGVKAPDAKAEVNEQPVHFGIICDECGTRNIRGTRYKSLQKENYDLCGECFGKPGIDAKDYIAMKGSPDRHFICFNGRFAGCDTKNSNSGVHRRGFEHPMYRRGRTGCAGGICQNGKLPGGSATNVEKQTSTPATGVEKQTSTPATGVEKQTSTPATNVEKQTSTPATADGDVSHHGVTCDECKTCPIVGPRFKSNKKYNYDLCHGCLQKIHGPASEEYTRIDNPVPQLYPHVLLKRYYGVSPTYPSFPFATYGRPRSPRQIYVATVIPHKGESETNPQNPAKDPEAATGGATERDGVSHDTDVPAKEQNGATGSEEKVVPNTNQIPEDNEAKNASHAEVDIDGLVSKLASMGFTDTKLNEELLRKNNFDLRSTVENLCAADDWDPILEELQEMGFYDSDLNRRLLFHNNGSVKRVVKELVDSEKVGRNKVSKGKKEE